MNYLRLLPLVLLCGGLAAQHEVTVTNPPASTSVRIPARANPAEGILQIDPPTADFLGNATVSVPLNLPPGRLGVEPRLTIDYHHEQQHGWVGTGWDVSLPSISVETRWGVPRFSSTVETETYLLNGEQLSPVAHRGGNRPRTADLQLYERVEGDFARILRHGDGPTNYWFEIARGDGTVEYYGGSPAEGVRTAATLAAPNGNLAAWALVATVDAYGNRIDYGYVRQADPGRGGSTEPGTNLYPDYIAYTGHDGEAGPFRIDFIRDRELGEARRPDVDIDGRLGFKRVTADLLRRIAITFHGEPLRSYELEYRTGPFDRSLLAAVVEIDAAGQEFYRHSFDYYDEITVDGKLEPFGPATTWETGTDNVQGPLANPLPLFPNDISSLGGATSTNEQAGTAITFGPVGSPVTKDFTVGGTVGFGASRAEGALSLVDINGDRLPDKVFRTASGLRYRANRGDGTFGPVRPIGGVAQFSVTETTEFSVGFEANLAPVFAGYENSNSTSRTTTYFTDFNGDELVDIVHRGTVYFNHLNAEGDPVFTRNSGDTPSPIVSGAAPDPTLVTVDPDEQEERIDMAPLHDVVRSWQAPWSGTVAIEAPVRLLDLDAYPRADGVTASVQHRGNVRWRTRIPAGDFGVRTPTNVDNIAVTAGDKIYFRVQSVFDGAYDRVHWDPTIYYTDRDTSAVDANGARYHHYRASEDFLLASCQSVRMPENGTVTVSGTFSKPRTTDTVIVRAFGLDISVLTAPIFREILRDTFPPDSVVTNLPLVAEDVAVTDEMDLQFIVESDSELRWSELHYQPRVVYTARDDGGAVVGTDGQPLYNYCPAADFRMHARSVIPAAEWRAPQDGDYRIDFAGSTPPLDGSVATLTVKGPDTLYAKVRTNRGLNGSSLTLRLTAGARLWVDYAAANILSAPVRAIIGPVGGGRENLRVGYQRQLTTDEMIFGNGHRGWGQFVYNGNRGFADRPIQENLLRRTEVDVTEEDVEGLDDIDPDDPGAFDGLEDLSGDPTTEPFVIMIADPKAGNWRGYDDLTVVGPDYQSSSRFGEDDILLAPDFGTGASAPAIITRVRHDAVAGGLSAGPGSLGVTTAEAWTTNVLDIMDMNGDGYPDLVTPTRIQYTGPYGGLEGASLAHGYGSHDSYSTAKGLTAGGGFANSSASNAGGSSGMGSRRRFRRTKATTSNSGAKAQSGGESAEGAASISGNFSEDLDHTEHSWQDMNGDGLEDKVWRNGDVALNYGYRFGARENWGFGEIRAGVSYDYGAGLGINISNNSIAGGVGVSRTDNWTRQFLQDMNGDGLTDRVAYDDDSGQLTVNLNHGTGFGPALAWGEPARPPDSGDATSESANAAFTVCINIIFVRFCVNPSGSLGRGTSRVLSQFTDVDGDGMPDEVYATTDERMSVRSSRLGRTNLLRNINGPLGGTTRIDYARAPAGYDLPFPKWVLSGVAVSDGVAGDGPEWRRARYTYAGPTYDRDEREFLGFREVRETHLDTERDDAPYRSYVTTYAQDNFYLKGLPLREWLEDAEGQPYGTTEYEYSLLDPETLEPATPDRVAAAGGRLFPALTARWERYQEGAVAPALSERTEFTYNAYGNLLTTTKFPGGQPEEPERTAYTYHPVGGNRYLTGVAASVEIRSGERLLRRTETEVDAAGQPVLIRRYIDESAAAEREMSYDRYGNLIALTEPATHNGDRNRYGYEYDSVVHTYQVSQTDGYGYVSRRSYDPRFGAATSVTNIQGYRTTFTLDVRGRTVDVRLPLDPDYSYRYAYHPEAAVPYAVTEHYDPAGDRAILRRDYTDGLGRPLRSEQQMEVDGRLQFVTSGKQVYDAFDRITLAYHPTAPASAPPVATRTTYDVQDRPLRRTEPHGAVSELSYDLAPLPEGELQLRETLTDARGNRSSEYLSPDDRVVATRTERAAGDLWVRNAYNTAGDLLTTTDAVGCVTRYDRDLLGRTVRKTPCNAGATDYELDAAGLLVSKITPNLRALNPDDPLRIRYTYELDRLVGIDYPKNYQNRVELTYGAPDAPHNRAGRIWMTVDASGGEEVFFDANGNVTKSIRTLLINEASLRTYVSEARFDSWGRMTELIYPDGEVVTYGFGADGRPVSMRGERDGIEYPYLRGVTYDAFGTKSGLTLGDGTTHRYTYDPGSRRLTGLRFGEQLELAYELDGVGNPTVLETRAGSGGLLTANGRQVFDYDESNQLTEASGGWEGGAGEAAQFTYFADYGKAYNPTLRDLRQYRGADTLVSTQRYTYGDGRAHQPTHVSGRRFDYDDNGNQLGYAGETGSYRYAQYRWDEEDRMVASNQNGRTTQFTYAADGSRAIQSEARRSGIFTAGAPTGFLHHGSDYLAYVSPFFTARRDGFTKHYFLGDTRIASKEGTGKFNNYYWFGRGLTAGDRNYVARRQDLAATVWNYYGDLGVPPGPPTLPGFYGQPERTGVALPTTAGGDYPNPPPGWPGPTGPPDPNGPPGAPTYFPPATPRDSVGAGYGFTGYAAFPEAELVFYHTGPLGNVHLVTNAEGEAEQFNAYLPNGERALVNTKRAAPVGYAFNGKETDALGQLYYFGERFYGTEFGLWLSQDPLADSYPGFNPYAFGLNNPLANNDPDGRAALQVFNSSQAAAVAFARVYNKRSFAVDREFGATIYRKTLRGRQVYFYEPNVPMGGRDGLDLPPHRRGFTPVADVHTHGMMQENADGFLDFSRTDVRAYLRERKSGYRNYQGYMVNPKGELLRYSRSKKKYAGKYRYGVVVKSGLPYDETFYNGGSPDAPRRGLTRVQRFRRNLAIRGRQFLQGMADLRTRMSGADPVEGVNFSALATPRRPRRAPGRHKRR